MLLDRRHQARGVHELAVGQHVVGMREVMQAQGSVWELKLMELVTTIVGGGLLGGCVALILDRIKKS